MTLRYTHIGIGDQARALANLPSVGRANPDLATERTALHGRCISDVVPCHNTTLAVIPTDRQNANQVEKNRELATVDTQCPSLSKLKKVAARGVEPRRLSAPDPKSGVSANFTKRPDVLNEIARASKLSETEFT